MSRTMTLSPGMSGLATAWPESRSVSPDDAVARDAPEIAGEDGGRPRPPDERPAKQAKADQRSKDHDCGQQQGADGVDMVHGVERDAALKAGRLIAQAGSCPGVRALVDAQREDQDNELKQSLEKCG